MTSQGLTFDHVFGVLKWQFPVLSFNYLEPSHAWGALSEDIIGGSMGFIRVKQRKIDQ